MLWSHDVEGAETSDERRPERKEADGTWGQPRRRRQDQELLRSSLARPPRRKRRMHGFVDFPFEHRSKDTDDLELLL